MQARASTVSSPLTEYLGTFRIGGRYRGNLRERDVHRLLPRTIDGPRLDLRVQWTAVESGTVGAISELHPWLRGQPHFANAGTSQHLALQTFGSGSARWSRTAEARDVPRVSRGAVLGGEVIGLIEQRGDFVAELTSCLCDG